MESFQSSKDTGFTKPSGNFPYINMKHPPLQGFKKTLAGSKFATGNNRANQQLALKLMQKLKK